MSQPHNPLDGMFTQMQGAAVGLHEFFRSLVGAGFTEDQAIILINNMIAASIATRNQPPGGM